jgi:hypothetical protein
MSLEAFGVLVFGKNFLRGFGFGWVKSRQVNTESFNPSHVNPICVIDSSLLGEL